MSGWTALYGVGALCLVLCGWCAGDGIWMRAQAHQKALQKTLELLDRIRREIEFRRADLSALFLALQREGFVGPEEQSFQTMAPFPQLSRREKAVFRTCMAGLGRTEAEQECRRLELYITQFEAFQTELLPNLKVTKELSHKIGLAAGLAAAILLL